MLEKLAKKRKLIALILLSLLFLLWLLYLIFAETEDKSNILLLCPLCLILFYVFIRFGFWIVKKNASPEILKFFLYFFFFGSFLCLLLSIIWFITGFPDGLSPTLGSDIALNLAVLAEANHFFTTPSKES